MSSILRVSDRDPQVLEQATAPNCSLREWGAEGAAALLGTRRRDRGSVERQPRAQMRPPCSAPTLSGQGCSLACPGMKFVDDSSSCACRLVPDRRSISAHGSPPSPAWRALWRGQNDSSPR